MGAKQVGIVLGEAADPGQPRQLARLLVAIDRAKLRQPHRQLAVAPRLGRVNLDVVRAVHRLEQVFLEVAGLLEIADPLGRAHLEERLREAGGFRSLAGALGLGHALGDAGLGQQQALAVVVETSRYQAVEQLLRRRVGRHLERGKLRFLVIRVVPAGLVELDLADMRRIDRLVAALDQLVLDEALEDAADDRPFGHPEDQARPDQRRDREEVEVAAEPAMVAFLGLFDLGDVGLQLLLVEERGAVNALKHLAVGPALPVSPGDREQLERPDLAGVGNMRPAAQVDKLPLAIEAQDAVLVQLVVDVLDLERLAQVGDELPRLGDRQAEPLERLGVLDDPGHLGLDGGEVVLGEASSGHLDVVIKAAGGRRSKGEPHAGKDPHDGPGHDVRRRVPQDVECLAVPGREDPHLDRGGVAIFERTIEVDDLAPRDRRDRRVRQPLADRQRQPRAG